MWILGVLLIVLLIGGIFFVLQNFFRVRKKNDVDKNEYLSKELDELRKICSANHIECPPKNIADIEKVWIEYDSSGVIPTYYWNDDSNIVFYDDFKGNMLVIPTDDILYFNKCGGIAYTNRVVDKGKNISISGAVVGGIIAGGAGAIIGATKDSHKIDNVTVKHDDVRTHIYFKSSQEIKIVAVEGEMFYNCIMQLLPQKDYLFARNTVNEESKERDCNNSLEESFVTVKSLYEKGLIDENEYKEKKAQLLNEV